MQWGPVRWRQALKLGIRRQGKTEACRTSRPAHLFVLGAHADAGVQTLLLHVVEGDAQVHAILEEGYRLRRAVQQDADRVACTPRFFSAERVFCNGNTRRGLGLTPFECGKCVTCDPFGVWELGYLQSQGC